MVEEDEAKVEDAMECAVGPVIRKKQHSGVLQAMFPTKLALTAPMLNLAEFMWAEDDNS